MLTLYAMRSIGFPSIGGRIDSFYSISLCKKFDMNVSAGSKMRITARGVARPLIVFSMLYGQHPFDAHELLLVTGAHLMVLV